MPPEDSFDALHSAVQVFARPRPVPYRNDQAYRPPPRPLPRRMRPADVRANDPSLSMDARRAAFLEMQRHDQAATDLAATADANHVAQYTPDPEHTPLENGVLGVARAYGPGAAYDAVRAGGRIAGGDNSAWGDLALNTGIAALPFLGVRGLRGEPAPVPMREPATPLPSQAWNTFGDLPPAEAPRPVAPDAGHAGRAESPVAPDGGGAGARDDLFPETAPGPLAVYHGTLGDFAPDEIAPWSHFGTRQAARDRLDALVDPQFRGAENGPNARILPYEITGRRIHVGDEDIGGSTHGDVTPNDVADLLLRRGHITTAEHAWATEPLANGARYLGRDAADVVKERLSELASRHDIGAIGYGNTVEDAGSTSYIVPNPRNNVRPRPVGGGATPFYDTFNNQVNAGLPPLPEGPLFPERGANDRGALNRLGALGSEFTDSAAGQGFRGEPANMQQAVDAALQAGPMRSAGLANSYAKTLRQLTQRGDWEGFTRLVGRVGDESPGALVATARAFAEADPALAMRAGDFASINDHLSAENFFLHVRRTNDPQIIRNTEIGRQNAARTPPARGGAPPPTDPKSLPRRKPPLPGGFTVFGAPR